MTRSPVVLILATGLVALLLIAWGTYHLAQRAAEEEARADTCARTIVFADLAAPMVPPRLAQLDARAIESFREMLAATPDPLDGVARIKVWRSDGTIVYSDEPRLIGEQYVLDEEEQSAIRADECAWEVSDLDARENRFEGSHEELIEVYTSLRPLAGEPLLFEAYFDSASVDRRRDQILGAFGPIAVGALALVVLVATALLAALTRQVRRGAVERERLLQAAVEASDAERGRIARDLHDGVVQDLAGASFAVSAMSRNERLPEDARTTLGNAGGSLRTSLRALRSLMVEIYPPDLHATGLAAAVEDLLAPATARDVVATAEVSGVDGVSEATVALVWRVAQEAVRNALRHSGAQRLDVRVEREGDVLVLEVVDDGVGFDLTRDPDPTSFGLRGMSSLIADAGGRLDVRSAPGAGTTVRLEVGVG